MTKTDIIRKLTSRKLWLAVALFISGLITAFGGSNEAAQTVAGCIMQGAAVVSYVLAEGWADASANAADVVVNGIAVEELKHAAGGSNNPVILDGIDVDDLDDDQLREVAVQMGLSRGYVDSLNRDKLLEAMDNLADETE